jgi:hypothetical protein
MLLLRAVLNRLIQMQNLYFKIIRQTALLYRKQRSDGFWVKKRISRKHNLKYPDAVYLKNG